MKFNLSNPSSSDDRPTLPSTPSSKKIVAVNPNTKPTCFHCDAPLEKILVVNRRWVCECCKDKK